MHIWYGDLVFLAVRQESGIFAEDYQLAEDIIHNNNSDYLQKARKYGHFTGYKN